MLPVLDTLLDEIFKSYVKHWVRFDNHRSYIPICREKKGSGQSPWNLCNAHCASQRTAFSQRTQSVMRASQGPTPQPTFFQVRWGSCLVRFPFPNPCALKASEVWNLSSDAFTSASLVTRVMHWCTHTPFKPPAPHEYFSVYLPSILVKYLNP